MIDVFIVMVEGWNRFSRSHIMHFLGIVKVLDIEELTFLGLKRCNWGLLEQRLNIYITLESAKGAKRLKTTSSNLKSWFSVIRWPLKWICLSDSGLSWTFALRLLRSSLLHNGNKKYRLLLWPFDFTGHWFPPQSSLNVHKRAPTTHCNTHYYRLFLTLWYFFFIFFLSYYFCTCFMHVFQSQFHLWCIHIRLFFPFSPSRHVRRITIVRRPRT